MRITDASIVFAVPGSMSIIDVVNPETGRSLYSGRTLEDIRAESPEYATAQRMRLGEHCEAKAKVQDAPVTWSETTVEQYEDMLECLPPAIMRRSCYLVGEPMDHHAVTGEPLYTAYLSRNPRWWEKGGKYWVGSRPMSVRQFCAFLDDPSQFPQ